jgi:hypothetical protein
LTLNFSKATSSELSLAGCTDFQVSGYRIGVWTHHKPQTPNILVFPLFGCSCNYWCQWITNQSNMYEQMYHLMALHSMMIRISVKCKYVLLCKINLFGIKSHYAHIFLYWRCTGNVVHHIVTPGWSSPMNLKYFCSPKACCSIYDTRIWAQAGNIVNELTNLQRKKLLALSNFMFKVSFYSYVYGSKLQEWVWR